MKTAVVEFNKGDLILYRGELYKVDKFNFKDNQNVAISKPGSLMGTWVLKYNMQGESNIIKLNPIDNPEYYL